MSVSPRMRNNGIPVSTPPESAGYTTSQPEKTIIDHESPSSVLNCEWWYHTYPAEAKHRIYLPGRNGFV